jgi:hypothetical protein
MVEIHIMEIEEYSQRKFALTAAKNTHFAVDYWSIYITKKMPPSPI